MIVNTSTNNSQNNKVLRKNSLRQSIIMEMVMKPVLSYRTAIKNRKVNKMLSISYNQIMG